MALWTPANLTVAPVEWFKADTGVTLSGSNVTALAQQGSLTGGLVVPSGFTGPTQGSLNSLTTLSLPGTASNGLQSSATRTYASGARTFYVVAKRTSGRTAGYDVLINTDAPWNVSSGFCLQYDTGSTGVITTYGGNGYGSSGPLAQTTNSSGPAQDGFWHTIEAHNKATTMAMAFDGNVQTLSASTAATAPTMTGYLFDVGFNPDGNPFGGEIAEIIVLGYEPTSGENAQIQGYLAWKWGNTGTTATDLVGKLPSGHTYKSAAPTTGGGTTTPKTVTVTSTSAVASARASGKKTAVTSSSAVTSQRSTAKKIAVVGASALTFKKALTKAVAITSVSTVAVKKAITRSLAVLSTSAVALTSGRAFLKAISVTSSSAVSLATSRAYLRTIAVTSSSAVASVRSMSKVILVASTGVVQPTKGVTRSFSITSVSTVGVSSGGQPPPPVGLPPGSYMSIGISLGF